MFKKAFDVPYEDSASYPTRADAVDAVTKYCEASGEACVFTGDDEVEISGRKYEICRGSVLLIWAMALCAEKNKFRFRDIELGLLKSASMSL